MLLCFGDGSRAEERKRDGYFLVLSPFIALQRAPASRLIAHTGVSVTLDSRPARQEEMGWGFLFPNITGLNIADLVLCVSHPYNTRTGSLG